MSTEARARNFTRYGAISAALLLAAGSITLLGVPACADPPAAGSCDNAPKEGAEYLSDPCDWRALERAIESAGSRVERSAPGQESCPVFGTCNIAAPRPSEPVRSANGVSGDATPRSEAR